MIGVVAGSGVPQNRFSRSPDKWEIFWVLTAFVAKPYAQETGRQGHELTSKSSYKALAREMAVSRRTGRKSD